MKKIAIALLGILLVISCKTEKKESVKNTEETTKEIAGISPEIMESAVIYEANIRQYSTEGSFDAFTKDIPQLKKLGVKIIWIMPIFPISETKRKATGGDFASKIEDPEERKKALGSYYAVSDFTKVNPEFGTIEDFRELLKTAHDNDIYVILDWVPNHTGWDHTWLKSNLEFYVKNSKGEITDPLNEDGTSKGWGDVAQLDYTNELMQETMIKDMLYWVDKENTDGFRCDHIEPIPVSFWEKAIPQLREKRSLFMLAENDEPRFLKGNLFDMGYGWKAHHLMNDIANGKKTVKDWDKLIDQLNKTYDTDDIIMNFITNHDENSWAGTVTERLGDAKETMLALSYITSGMPLIYSGQEYDMSHRLKFFEKDSIPKIKGKTWNVLEKLGALKNLNPALNGGKNAASYKRINTDNSATILIIERAKDDEKIVFIANLSNESTSFSSPIVGSFNDYMNNSEFSLKENQQLTFKPWEYKIIVN